MANAKIKTHTTESYREHYMYAGPPLEGMLKQGINKFFVVKVEDMIRQMKLPVPPTRAESHTIIYLTDGEAVMNIGSHTYTIYQHECLVVPAGQVFSFSNIDLNQGYLCHFNNDMLVGKTGVADLVQRFSFLHVWGDPRITLGVQTSGFVQHIFQRLLLAYIEKGLADVALLQSYLLALLCELRNAVPVVADSNTGTAAGIADRFRQLLIEHIRTKHRVTDYAALLNITPNHLNKSVKAATGQSPTKWIDEAIIRESKVLLHQSELSISDVAATLGLQDPSYFSRLFRKQEHMTPLQFRRMIEKS